MALYTRQEFQDKCQITRGYLNVYIKRKKIILTGNMIDDAVPENAFFLEKQLAKNGGESPTQSSKKPTAKLSEAAVAKVKEKQDKEPSKEATEMYGLSVEKKAQEVKKLKSDIETAEMKRAKMAGELIPTDLVMTIFASHFKSVTVAFHQAANNFLSTIAKQNQLDRDQVAKIRGELIDITNKSVKAAIEASKKEVTNLVAEYSQSKGKGEKE